MGFLKDVKFLLILAFLVGSQTHVIRSRDTSGLANSENFSEGLRTPQKYIITPVQTITKNSENGEVAPYDTVEFGTDDKYNEIESEIEVTHQREGFRSDNAENKNNNIAEENLQEIEAKTAEVNEKRTLPIDGTTEGTGKEIVGEFLESKITRNLRKTVEDLGDSSITASERVLSREDDNTSNDMSGITQNLDKLLVHIGNSEEKSKDNDVKSLVMETAAKHIDEPNVFKAEHIHNSSDSKTSPNINTNLANSEDLTNSIKEMKAKIQKSIPISRKKDNINKTATKSFYPTPGSGITQHFGRSLRNFEEFLDNDNDSRPKFPETLTIPKFDDDSTKQIQFENLKSSSESNNYSIIVKTSSDSSIPNESVAEPEVTKLKSESNSKANQEFDVKSPETNVEDEKVTQSLDPRQLLGRNIEGQEDLTENVKESEETSHKSEETLKETPISYEIPLIIKLNEANEFLETPTNRNLQEIIADSESQTDEILSENTKYSKTLNELGDLPIIGKTLEVVASEVNEENSPTNDIVTSFDSEPKMQLSTGEFSTDDLERLAHSGIVIQIEDTETDPEMDIALYEHIRNAESETFESEMENYDEMSKSPLLRASDDFFSNGRQLADTSDNIGIIPETVGQIAQTVAESNIETLDNLAQTSTITDTIKEASNGVTETPSILPKKDLVTSEDSEKVQGNTTDDNSLTLETSPTTELNETRDDLIETLVETTDVATTPGDVTKPQETQKDDVESAKPIAANVGTDLKRIDSTSREPEKKLENSETISENIETTSDKTNKETEVPSTALTFPVTLQTEGKPDNLIQQSSGSSSPAIPPTEVPPTQISNENVMSTSAATPSILEPTQNTEPSIPKPSSSESPQVETEPSEFAKPQETLKDAVESGQPSATTVATDLSPTKSTSMESETKNENSETVGENIKMSSDKTNKDTEDPSPTLNSPVTLQTEVKPDNLLQQSTGFSSPATPPTEVPPNKPKPSSSEAPQAQTNPSEFTKNPETLKDSVVTPKPSATTVATDRNPTISTAMESENSETVSENSDLTADETNKETDIPSPTLNSLVTLQTEVKPDNLLQQSSGSSSPATPPTEVPPSQITNENVVSTSAATLSILEPTQNTEPNKPKPSSSEAPQAQTKPSEFTKNPETLKDSVVTPEPSATTVATDINPTISTPKESAKPHQNSETVSENSDLTADKTNKETDIPSPTLNSPVTLQTETKPDNIIQQSSGSSSPATLPTEVPPSQITNTNVVSTSATTVATNPSPTISTPVESENSETVSENSDLTADKTNKETDIPSPTLNSPVALQTETKPGTVIQESSASASSSPDTPPTVTSPNQTINENVASTSAATPSVLETTQNIEINKPKPSSSETSQAETKPNEFSKPQETLKDVMVNPELSPTNVASDVKPIKSIPSEPEKKPENSETVSENTDMTSAQKNKEGEFPSITFTPTEAPQTETKSDNLIQESVASTSAATPSILEPTQNTEPIKPNPFSSEIPQTETKPSDFTKPQETLKDVEESGEPTGTSAATDLKPIKSTPSESEKPQDNSEIVGENSELASDQKNKDTEFPSTTLTPTEVLQTETKPDNIIQDTSASSSPETPTTKTPPNPKITEPVSSTSGATPSLLKPPSNNETNKPKLSSSETPQTETKPSAVIKESVASTAITVPSNQKPIVKPESDNFSVTTIANLPKITIPSSTTSKPTRKTQQISLNQNKNPNKTINSSGKPNKTPTKSKPDLGNQSTPVHSAAKPNRKPSTTTTTTPKPVRVVHTNPISTKKPFRGNPSSPVTPPTKKVNRRPTTAPNTIAGASSNQINKHKPSDPKPVTSKPNNPKPTKRPSLHPWFSNFPAFGGQSKPLIPAFVVNHINTHKRNKTHSTFGLGLFPVPWKWRPLNFTKPNFFTRHRITKPQQTSTKSNTQNQQDMGRDLGFLNAVLHKSSTTETGGLLNQFAVSKWNSTTENRRGINAATPASLNNSTLEVTSSGRGSGSSSRDSGGENTPPTPVTASTGSNPTGRQRQQRFVATLNCINGSSNVNNVEDENDDNDQFIVNRQRQQQQQQRQQQLEEPQHQLQRPILCRTPPPNYHSLAVTPPPSYTPRQQIQTSPANSTTEDVATPHHQQHHQYRQHLHSQSHSPSALRRCQVPEVLGLGIDGYDDDVQLNGLNIVGRQQRQQATARATTEQADADAVAVVVNAQNRRQVLVANGRLHQPARNVATVSQQQRRRKQRRRKLHLLQQQHQQQHHYNHHHQPNLPIVNGSTSDSDSSSILSGISQDSNELAIGGTTRDQRRRRRQRLLKLRDAYCPDLLNACSLILLQQQTSDSTVGSFTDTPPELVHESSDYVEITEYQRNHQRLQNAQSTPEIHYRHHRHDRNRLNGVDERREATRERAASEAEENQRLQHFKREMGQNLSIRRPRISLTWVLREQQQQQQQQQQPNEPEAGKKEGENKENHKETQGNKTIDSQRLSNNNQVNGKVSRNQEANNQNSGVVEKKKYRLKQIPGSTEPLNGYATTPTSYTNASTALGSQKFFSNQNLLEYHKDDVGTKPPSKDLLFVCTPQRVPDGFGGSSEALALAKKRNEIRKKLAAKMAQFRSENQATRLVTNISTHLNGGVVSSKRESKSTLKSGSYSEPSLIAASEGNSRRHRHRKRRERNRPPKFGYDIKNVDEFLTKCSLASPANIPMVLSTSCILYQTRPGGYQTEISLPLGMVVNAVFKNQNWLYVQTPHAEEGYVNYTTCLPLGILPPEARKEGKSEAKTKPCWDTNGDVFPKPCGNMTDSEKEIHLRVGTRSEGARTPRLKSQLTDNETATVISAKTDKTDCVNGNTSSIYGEQQVDKLYLRAASQPKLTEKTSYAQLKIIRNHSSAASATSSKSQVNDEYVTLHQKGVQKHVHHIPAQKTYISRTFITNGHNGQHLHPKDMKNLQQQQQIQAAANNCNNLKNPTAIQQQLNNATTTITVTSYPPTHQIQSQQQQQQLHHHPTQPHRHHHHQQQQQQQSLSSSTSLHHINNQSSMTAATTTATTTTVAPRSILNAIRRSSAHCGQRQTLVAITTDYSTGDGLTLQKGDIVTLCECRETKDHRQWFYVRTRDGRQGYIPAEVAGHGYL